MAEYATLKVPELKKLLGEKGLAQTGNKADLVARLQEHDKSAAPAATEEKPVEGSKPAEEKDEIDFSDDEATTSKPAPVEAAAAVDATTVEQTDVAPAVEAVTTEEAPAEDKPVEEEKPATNYAAGLASTAADEEVKKRADRAKRFGIEEEADTQKLTERAERFGVDEKDIPKGLDAALPERGVKRGRGRTDTEEKNRPDKKQSLDRRGGRNRRGRGGREPQQNRGAGQERKPRAVEDPAEKAKAEARKARFAAM